MARNVKVPPAGSYPEEKGSCMRTYKENLEERNWRLSGWPGFRNSPVCSHGGQDVALLQTPRSRVLDSKVYDRSLAQEETSLLPCQL